MNTLFNINNINTMGMTNPTPISDIRKVEFKDGILMPLIEQHKKENNSQVTLFG